MFAEGKFFPLRWGFPNPLQSCRLRKGLPIPVHNTVHTGFLRTGLEEPGSADQPDAQRDTTSAQAQGLRGSYWTLKSNLRLSVLC